MATPLLILRTARDGSTALLTLRQAMEELHEDHDLSGLKRWCDGCARIFERQMRHGWTESRDGATYRMATRKILQEVA